MYQYGFETLIASILYFINLFILYYLCYCPIRQFSIGYYDDSYRTCFMTFISLYLIN
ncbi:hypothetical protein [Faecalimicrobium sp. JNUCC 81]